MKNIGFKNWNLEKNIPLIILIIIAILSKILKFQYFYGISIDLTSISLILILLLYGQRKAITISIGLVAFELFVLKGPYFSLIYILEVYCLGYLYNRYKKVSVIVSDIIFWVLIGIPSIAVFFIITNSFTANQYLLFEIGFIIVNAIFNVYIAEVIYMYYARRRLQNKPILVTFKHIIIHLVTSALIIPFVINILVDLVETNEYIGENVKTYSKEVVYFIEDEISKLDARQKVNLQLSSIVEVGMLKDSIRGFAKYKPFNIYVTNQREELVIEIINYGDSLQNITYNNYKTIELEEDSLYRVIAKSYEENLINDTISKGGFISETYLKDSGLTVIVEVPIEIYKDKIIGEYVSQFKFLIIFVFFMSIVAMILNTNVFNDLTRISVITSKFRELLESEEELNWPESNIHEIRELVANIRKMLNELRKNFVEIKRSEKQLYELAYYDTLTKLPNRLYFTECINKFSKLEDNNKKLGIIFMDLNRFKVINDTLGHNVGDELLIQVSNRLKKLNNDNISVFRLGGDEFVVVAEINNRDEILGIGKNISKQFEESFELNGLVINTCCSMGASVYPDDSDEINTITQYADISMYKAKESESRQVQLFNNELKEMVLEKLTIEKEIFNALKNDEFTLYFQPKYSAVTNKVKSLEALIRWSSEKLGVVPPDRFITIAEESDLILKIDRWVMIQACKQNKRLQDEGYPKVPISVNISAKHFTNEKIEKLVVEALEISGLEPRYLIIEITEGILIKKLEDVKCIIGNLNNMGICVSIDDFGKGYSSFSQLMNLPIKEVKIDRSFVSGIEDDKKKASIVESMIDLAHRLELNVVAEGVETTQEKNYIESIGCDELQGYIFTKPITINELKNLLKGENA